MPILESQMDIVSKVVGQLERHSEILTLIAESREYLKQGVVERE